MTHPQQSSRGAWHEEARRLRNAHPDWSNAKIGRALGVTGSAVTKALHPERRKEYNRRAESQPGRREAKLAWNRSEKARGVCRRCNGPRGIGTAHQGGDLCWPCERMRRAEVHETRLSIVEGMWDDGWLSREIAETLGYATPTGAGPYLDELRKAGRIGYRYAACAQRAAA